MTQTVEDLADIEAVGDAGLGIVRQGLLLVCRGPSTGAEKVTVGPGSRAGGMVEIFLFIIAAGVIAHFIGASVHEGIFVGALVGAPHLTYEPGMSTGYSAPAANTCCPWMPICAARRRFCGPAEAQHRRGCLLAQVSMSSTSIVVKCLHDSKATSSPHGQITIGTLILQARAAPPLSIWRPASVWCSVARCVSIFWGMCWW